ncbi:hypothetical protein PIL02S_04816 [Paenibacillus illinoisensis]|uniref:Uncharacterized protein n=1 Tax=Paenibacillus illinoisensis TaxID=59845 RepID=A0A2W0C5E9_9BACL|nr:hypothetical protein PIL02S_04816 [Paenibacillus illinoisensis]
MSTAVLIAKNVFFGLLHDLIKIDKPGTERHR